MVGTGNMNCEENDKYYWLKPVHDQKHITDEKSDTNQTK